MNQKRLQFAAFLLSGLLFAACGKDDDNDVKPTGNEPEFPTEYSKLTVEQNKEKLEDNGIELVNNITTLKNASGIQTAIAFSYHLDEGVLPENLEGGRVKSNSGITLMRKLANFGTGKTSAAKTLSGLRITEEEFESFQQFYDDLIGVYAYNKTTNEWVYTPTGNKIVFQFPSTKTGASNDAEFSIYDYKGVQIASELGGDDYTGDYPTALKTELKVGGVTKMLYTFSASYNSAGDPSAVSIALTIDDYTFSYDISNSTTEAKVDYVLSKAKTNLVSWGARATGTFSAGAVNENEDIGAVVNTSTAYFQIMNIKFSGEIKAKTLDEALEVANSAQETAAAWNANYDLIVFYADSKEKIADSEFYVTTETNTWWDCFFDENDEYVCEEIEEEDEVVDVRLVFADETKADLATYTDIGFDDINQKLEDFVDDLENDIE